MAFNIFSTLNQNLQNFGGDAYDAYQAGKSKVGNVASTINNNLQDFGGDIYDVGSTIKKNVSNFGTQTYNQGKQAVNQIQSNVSQFGTDVANKASAVKKSILAPADRFMTDVTKIGNARKATQYGISEKDKSALMNQMLDAGQYSDDEIIQAVAQLDAEEKARKQKEFSDWQSGSKANANIGQKALAGALNLGGGAIAGIGQGTLGIADFATGGKIDALKQEKQAYDEAIANNQGAFTVGKNIGQIGASFAAPGLGKLAPTGTSLAATAGRGAVYGGVYGAANPIMEKGSEATASDIGYGALGGAAMGAVAGPLLEKVVAPAIGKVAQSTTSGLKAAKFTQGSISDKIGAGLRASGKNISRGVKSIPMGGETFTRNIPKAIVKRDLGFTPTQRAKIENITGGDEAQYILKKGLAGKPKEELAQIFMKQADDAYNGITTKLAKIDKTVKSTSADEALQDILDQLSSPKLKRAYAKDIVGIENMLKKGEYTLSELNNIRRAYDKVNTGMFTAKGTMRSSIENAVDVKIRQGLSEQLQKEAKVHGVDVKEMNKELRAGLEMKDALLSRLSQEERNNFLGLQDLGVSAILSGGEPVSAVATIAAKKYAEKVAPGLAQKAYNLNKNPNVTRRVSRGNTITPRNKSSGLGLASSSSTPMVSDSVKPPIVPKAKPKATTESPFKNNKGFINPSEIKKSLVPKKGVDEARQFYDDLVYAGNSPIVAQRETAKRFGTIRAMSASKAGTMEIGSSGIIPKDIINEAKDSRFLIKKEFEPKEVWRGVGGNSEGTGFARYGQGLYTTSNKKMASQYAGKDGKLLQMDRFDDIPSNPAWFANDMDFNNFLHYDVAKKMGLKNASEIQSKYKDLSDLFQDMGFDGIVIGKGKDNEMVKFATKPKVVPKVVESKGMEIPEELAQEARKYKSADDFIKAQGEILYHGGGNIKEVGNMRSKWQAFYMTDNPTYAKSYGGPNSVLNEIIILPKAKIVDMLNLSDDFLQKLDKMLFDSNKLSRGSVDTIVKGIKAGKAYFAEDPNVKAILKKMGYDGMITRESKLGLNYGVWNKNVLKTKEQLKQMYEQANKPKATNKK